MSSFYEQNKKILWGAAAGLAVVAGVQMYCSSLWGTAAENLIEAEKQEQVWDKFFHPGEGKVKRDEGMKELAANEALLNESLKLLDGLTLGDAVSLKEFSVKNVTGDRKNDLDTKKKRALAEYQHEVLVKSKDTAWVSHVRKQIAANQVLNGKFFLITPADELGLVNRDGSDDPVSTNLLRLHMSRSVMAAVKAAQVPVIIDMRHGQPQLLERPGDAEEAAPKPASKSKSGKQEEKAEKFERLVMFPMQLQVMAREKQIGTLLYELQRPTVKSDPRRSHLSVRGMQINVETSEAAARGSRGGNIERFVFVTINLNGYLGEKLTESFEIPLKEQRGGRRNEIDPY